MICAKASGKSLENRKSCYLFTTRHTHFSFTTNAQILKAPTGCLLLSFVSYLVEKNYEAQKAFFQNNCLVTERSRSPK